MICIKHKLIQNDVLEFFYTISCSLLDSQWMEGNKS